MKKLIALMTLVAISQLDANSVTFKNDTPDTLTVSLKAKYKIKKNGAPVTRHNQQDYTLKPADQAKFDFKGDIQIFDIVDKTQTSIPKLASPKKLKGSDGSSIPKSNGYLSITLVTDTTSNTKKLQTSWKVLPGNNNTENTETPSEE